MTADSSSRLGRTTRNNISPLAGQVHQRSAGSLIGRLQPRLQQPGEVIGVDVAGSGHGLAINGFAIPINQALAIAKQIDTRQQHH